MRKILLALILISGCTSNSGGVALMPGFNPPDPGANGIQFVIPEVKDIAPGADETFCTYLDWKADKDLDIVNYEAFTTVVGSHHTLLYAVQNNEPTDTHICNEDDMVNARYLAGGGADSPSTQLPEGVVLRVPAKTQTMIQHHWINATDSPINGQVAFNVTIQDPKPDDLTAQLFTDATTTLSLPPGVGSASASCVVQADMNFFSMGGHAHNLGTEVSINYTPVGGAPQMIYDTPWNNDYQFNPPRNQYTKDAPFTMHAGDTLTANCTYNNTTGNMVIFPTEMCVAWGYYFPADNEIDCTDGIWGN